MNVLFVATQDDHIYKFHVPFMNWFKEQGYEVHIAANFLDYKEELEELGFILHQIDFSRNPLSKNNIKAIYQVRDLLRGNPFSLIHVNTPIAAFITRFVANKERIKPIVYTAHGFHFYKGAPIMNWLLYYPLEKIAARWTDALITMNEEDYLAAQKLMQKTRGKAYKVHGVGVDLSRYKKDDEARYKKRRELNIDEEQFVLLSIGEINKNKNQKQVIEAIALLPGDLKYKIVYLIAGKGKQEREIKSISAKYGLDKQVVFLGYSEDIPNLINAADIVLSTSYREGLPKNVIEAMATEKPVIGTDIRGNRDLIKQGEIGLLVPVGDYKATAEAITKLITDKEFYVAVGNAAKRYVEQFGLDNVLKKMADIYHKLVENK